MGSGLAGSAAPPLTCPPVGIPLCPLNRFFAMFTTKLPSPVLLDAVDARSSCCSSFCTPPRCTVQESKSCAAASQRGGVLAGVPCSSPTLRFSRSGGVAYARPTIMCTAFSNFSFRFSRWEKLFLVFCASLPVGRCVNSRSKVMFCGLLSHLTKKS